MVEAKGSVRCRANHLFPLGGVEGPVKSQPTQLRLCCDAVVQAGGAEAAEAILSAGSDKYLALCQRWADSGEPIAVEDNFRLWTLFQQGGALASEAVELLFQAVGAFATKEGTKMGRYFRDVQMYRTHSSAQRDEFATYLARRHVGRPTGFRGL